MCWERHSHKHKSLGRLCCFRPNTHRVLHNEDDASSPSTTTRDVRGVIGRINRHVARRHNKIGGSVNYSYDPVSYALNFESDEVLVHSFIARLPASPILPTSKDLKAVLCV